MELKILESIEEQIAVRFTGKVNILAKYNRQYLGHILFKDGEVIQAIFQNHKGLKAFYQLIIQEYSLQAFEYVVEPEVVDEKERKIHFPYAVIKNKLSEVLKQYRESLKLRPPENVRVVINGDFMKSSTDITPHEFEVLDILTEYNSPNDIYQHCALLDHEITLALVGLRKKGGLKIIAPKSLNG